MTPGPPTEVGRTSSRPVFPLPIVPLPIFLMTNSLETGGSERQFAALARSLDRAQFDVNLGCIMREGAFLTGLGEIAEFGLGGSLYGLESHRTRWRLSRHLKSHQIEVAHAFDFYTNLTLIPAARWARVPVVIGSQRQMGDLLTWKQERVQAAALRWCDAVVCNSHAAAERLRDLGLLEDKLVVIRNGLPAEAFVDTPPAWPRTEGTLRVGMIARMNTRAKNHELFLGAAARLRPRFPRVQFVLVGDGPFRAEFERRAQELGLGESVLFTGERRDIPAVMASLDVSVLPSGSESLSNVILESMAAGVVVVATRVGGNGEVVQQGRGILVPPGDEEALTAAIERLLRDAAMRRSLAENARKFARENFTLERMTRQHEELYAELAACKQSGAMPCPNGRGQRPLRVAMVAASSRYVGGQSVQAEALLRGWRDDPEVRAEFVPIDPEFPKVLKWMERVPILRTVIREPIYLLRLLRRLEHADVVHIFSASYWSFLLAPAPALRIARWLGKKSVLHYHSGEARDHLRRFLGARETLGEVDRLVVPSGYLVDVFREFGLEGRAIPNIVDLEQLPFRERKVCRPHLICTRGFHRYYGLDIVVRAFAEVQREFPEARLDLPGGGPAEAEIRALVRELRLRGVEFPGVIAHDEIGRRYDRADIFINASRLDNMPVSVLEAFACGLPVVSTNPEGMSYFVEHERTGLLSSTDDAHMLAANVMRALHDPELAGRLATNARREVERYSWKAVRGQWLEVYRSLGRS